MCVFLAIGAMAITTLTHAQTVSQYTNTTVGAITDVSCGTTSPIIRAFSVPTNFVVGDVDVGVFLTHTYRSDLRITLQSPAGLIVPIMSNTAGSGDNLNDLFDDEATTAISAHNATVTDPITPAPSPPATPYSHSFKPTSPLSAFDGQNAVGTWALVICDSVAQDVGNFLRADLFVTSAGLSVVKSSTVVNDAISVSNPKAIPGATVQYCVVVTNSSAAAAPPLTNIVMNDLVPSNSSYVPGSILSGTTCAGAITPEDDNSIGADESDPFGANISGGTITGLAPSLVSGGTFVLVFRVTVN